MLLPVIMAGGTGSRLWPVISKAISASLWAALNAAGDCAAS